MAFVRPKVISVFSYSTFKTKLYLEEKSLEVNFEKAYINFEMLFELESLISWCKQHVEVHSIVFNGYKESFLQGYDYNEVKSFEAEKVKRLQNKFEQILESLSALPQTILMNTKNGASDQGLEFALFGDQILARNVAVFKFDQLKNGFIITKKIELLLGQQFLRNLIFRPNVDIKNEMVKARLVDLCADKEFEFMLAQDFRAHTLTISPIARFYLKKSMLLNDENAHSAVITSKEYQSADGKFQNLHHYIYPELLTETRTDA